jgi:glucan biosynthesis protein C
MDNWFMHLLFLISGVGAAASLRKRTARRFIGERANRLLLPLLVGTLVVIAFQAWLRALSFGTFTGGFFAFYPSFFNGISSGPGSRYNFDYGQLWFLLYLFVFSVLALPLFLRLNRRGDSSPLLRAGRRLAASAAVLLPALWIGVLEAAFRPGWPGYQNLINERVPRSPARETSPFPSTCCTSLHCVPRPISSSAPVFRCGFGGG